MEAINLGGGWDDLFIKQQITSFISQLNIPSTIKIYIEPGSVLVRTAAVLKAKVIDESISNNTRCVFLNTSQFNNSSWYVPRIIASDKYTHKRMTTYIYGNTCFEGDFFGKMDNSFISFGSTVLMYPVGAYYNTTHRELHRINFPEEYLI